MCYNVKKMCRKSSLINGGDDAAAQRHFLELLEHEVALAVVVVEELAVFGQPATGIVAAVVAFARLEEVAHAVGHAVEAFHLAAAFVLGRDEVVELVVVVPSHAARNLVARHQQAVAHVPRVATAELLHVARTVQIVVRLPSAGSQCESFLDRQPKDRGLRLVM